MTDFIISPAEPATVKRALERHGEMEVGTLPERYGADILWRAHGKWWGVQRKAIPDFIASVIDGRLQREIGQMRDKLALPMIILEGRVSYSQTGMLMYGSYGRDITQQAFEGMLFSLANEGIHVLHSGNVEDTCRMIANFAAWSQKAKHDTFRRRPGPEQSSMWGKASHRDWARHLLMGFEGIGPTQADAIIDHFAGVPLAWMVTDKQLQAVKGIGPKRAKSMIDALREAEPDAKAS